MFDSYRISSKSYGDKMTSNLVVMSRKTSEEGELKCIVHNKLGSHTSKLTIKIIGRRYFSNSPL